VGGNAQWYWIEGGVAGDFAVSCDVLSQLCSGKGGGVVLGTVRKREDARSGPPILKPDYRISGGGGGGGGKWWEG